MFILVLEMIGIKGLVIGYPLSVDGIIMQKLELLALLLKS